MKDGLRGVVLCAAGHSVVVWEPEVFGYRDFAFLLGGGRVFSLTTADGARTELGVGVGDDLAAVNDAYPDAECGEYRYSKGSGYEWCRTSVGGNRLFLGGDPVESITVTRLGRPGEDS
ncbi:MAG: hypothetical protein ABR583_03065 [Gaiellaceae bacterium]